MVVKELVLTNWHYREASDDARKWQLARNDTYGNQIHLDLLSNGEIPDPFYDQNEKLVQWVAKKDFEYKSEFTIDPELKVHWLIFEGLDTFATVYVNDVKLLETDNMFRTYRLDVTDRVIDGVNQLRIVFKSALLEGRNLEKKHGEELSCWNGDPSRLHVRKAQYHYGWDWGPLLLTCGPWRPVKLVEFDVGKLDFDIDYTFTKEDLSEVEVEVTSKSLTLDQELKVDILLDDEVVEVGKLAGGSKLLLKSPKLWYPYNYGPQTKYTVVVSLMYNGEVVDSKHQLVGFRKTELVQEPLKHESGKSFYFKVNGIPIFIYGCNWIPSHSFHSATTKEHYRLWLEKAREGNFNMVRVWGGGIWEADWFYELCDTYGILVWQDFLFACGLYPVYDSLVQSLRYEMMDQLKRLKQYSCVVVYVGNNEDYQLAQSLSLEWDPKAPITEKSVFPARKIYEEVIPEVLSKVYNKIPISYQFGSPYSCSDDPGKYIPCEDPTVGDIHQWNVWHGTQEKYQDWDKLIGRFISEFGMLSCPNVETLQKYITDSKQLYPQSQTMDLHNKADGFERRLALYVLENFPVKDMGLDSWVYVTQLMQSECLRYAYRLWRRQWGQDGDRRCGGAIVWQLNDCWPVSSWSVVDCDLVPKIAFYGIKRECEPVVVGIKRNETIIREDGEPALDKLTPLHDYAPRTYDCDVWVVNALAERVLDVSIEVYDAESGQLKLEEKVEGVAIDANCSREVVKKLQILALDVVRARILHQQQVVHETSDWPQPLKYICWPETSVETTFTPSGDGFDVTLRTNNPVKGVQLRVDPPHYEMSDNGLDMFPGTNYTISVKPGPQWSAGEAPRISVRYLK